MPELSYGSHFFQDLVEAGILYSAVFKDETTPAFAPERLKAMADMTGELTGSEELKGIMYVLDMENSAVMLYYDMIEERLLITDGKKE